MAKSKKAPAKKTAAKPAAPAKPAKAAPVKAPVEKVAAKAPAPAKAAMTPADLKRKILERKSAGPAKSIAFSLDEVREIAKKNEKQVETPTKAIANGAKAATNGKSADAHAKIERAAQKPHHVKAASVADILGFNPNKGRKPMLELAEEEVPDKFRRYYRMLVDLRNHVLAQLGEHTEETLRKSAKDDSGDLSGYGQHMADAGTDTFDRDFALSLVSSEQEALSEIEAAIKRIHDGTYGVCESTQKPIAKERLLAVPFTRYSAEAKKEVERHSHRSDQRGGLFGDATDEDGGGKMTEDDAGDE
ncbi:MAG TPA: TraR/DksA C4-type zinc finger protein [Candidatus Didemnitutus sp.]|nr:TraR/DksA C4-type zinc finger protein [Candidatus Didemnitutus sp.]